MEPAQFVNLIVYIFVLLLPQNLANITLGAIPPQRHLVAKINTTELEPIKNVTNEPFVHTLNLFDTTILLETKGERLKGLNYTFKCQGQKVTNFDALHCSKLADCHRHITCLDQHTLEDCSQMEPGVPSNFVRGQSCFDPEKKNEENCISFVIHNPKGGRSLSSIVECSTGSQGHREIYHYMEDPNLKIVVYRIDAQIVERKPKINFKSRNYPGENKIYLHS